MRAIPVRTKLKAELGGNDEAMSSPQRFATRDMTRTRPTANHIRYTIEPSEATGTPSMEKMTSSLRNTSPAWCSGSVRVTRMPPSCGVGEVEIPRLGRERKTSTAHKAPTTVMRRREAATFRKYRGQGGGGRKQSKHHNQRAPHIPYPPAA